MGDFDREEMKVEALDLGYVRVTLVLRASVLPFHATGYEAMTRITKFALQYVAGAFPHVRKAMLQIVQEMPDESTN